MAARDRVRKPNPERTEPVRSWGTLFGSATPPPAAGWPEPAPSHGSDNTRPQTPTDPISNGVQAGYRVIDDYVKQGQNAARLVWGPILGTSGGTGSTGGEDLQQRFGTMIRTATDLATLWLDLLGSAPGGRSLWSAGAAYPFGAGAPPGAVPVSPFSIGQAAPGRPEPVPSAPIPREATRARAGTIVSLDITSARRTEVMLDLRSRSADHALRAHDLRAADSDAPRLTGVTIEGMPGEDCVLVRLRVPDDHPPGLYTGLILDDRTSLPCGTLAVRVVATSKS